MVQRKLALQADHIKSQKLFTNPELVKNRTPHEFKKKLKKSKSMKIPDIETSRSLSPSSSPIKTSEKIPNYMKSTTSSDARKDRARVQSQVSTQNCADHSNTKHSSGNKQSRNITKSSSSVKSVRTLTRNPSFKPARASSKKSSKMALSCADIDVQKATCSSTLKDSKFPDYLELEPEGTSVMKVCPYTYCSLNGHHHNPMPPLKMFLKAKRRSLRTQKSFNKMEALDAKKPDTDMDFYVQIYATKKEDEEKIQVVENLSESDTDSEATDMELDENHKVWFSVLEVENLCEDVLVCNEDVLVGEVMQEVIKVEKGCFEPQIDDSDLEQDGTEELSEESKNVEPQTQYDEYSNVSYEALENDGCDLLVGAQDTTEVDDQDSKCKILTNQSGLVEDCHGEIKEMEAQIEDDEDYNVSEGALDEELVNADKDTTEVDDQDCKNIISSSFDTYDSAETFPRLKGLFGISNEENGPLDSEKAIEFNPGEPNYLPSVPDQYSKNKISTSMDTKMNDDHDSAETFPKLEGLFGISNEELSSNRKWTIGGKKPIKDSEEESEFNPREPNYLPLVPEEEAEKVDLKHQMMDERKNADEWMLDYALQQTVTKLAPARKRKVALLVEAFESVLPIPRHESRIRHPLAAAFPHTPRPIQACN